jgi:integral membrane protein (TIGR01906 family)
MEIARKVAVILFIALVPIFMITTSVRWVINFPGLYSYGFDKYNIPDYTGIQRDDLLDAAAQLRDYFNNDDEDIVIRTFVLGVLRENLYNQREIDHMRDVKVLVNNVYRVQEVIGLYFLVFAAVGFYISRRRFTEALLRVISRGGKVTLSLVVVIGLLSSVAFNQLFLLFHLVSFSNDFWQLDPGRDYLIAMFPQNFFFDATMLIALSTVALALILAFGPRPLRRWLPVVR